MNQEEIIELAKQAGMLQINGKYNIWIPEYLYEFAALVAAAEREACAKIVEPTEEHRRDASWGYVGGEEGVELLDGLVKQIRARGEKK